MRIKILDSYDYQLMKKGKYHVMDYKINLRLIQWINFIILVLAVIFAPDSILERPLFMSIYLIAIAGITNLILFFLGAFKKKWRFVKGFNDEKKAEEYIERYGKKNEEAKN